MEIIITLFLFVLLFAGILAYSTLSWGWVLFKFWEWFVLPVFVDLPPLYYWNAVGLMFVIRLFDRSTTPIKEDFVDTDKVFITTIFSPWLVLFIAWIIKNLFL